MLGIDSLVADDGAGIASGFSQSHQYKLWPSWIRAILPPWLFSFNPVLALGNKTKAFFLFNILLSSLTRNNLKYLDENKIGGSKHEILEIWIMLTARLPPLELPSFYSKNITYQQIAQALGKWCERNFFPSKGSKIFKHFHVFGKTPVSSKIQFFVDDEVKKIKFEVKWFTRCG